MKPFNCKLCNNDDCSPLFALQFEIVTIYGRVIHVSLQFNIVKTFCHNICKHGLKTKEVCDVEAGKY